MKAGFFEADTTPSIGMHSVDICDYGEVTRINTPFSFNAAVIANEQSCVALVGADLIDLDLELVESGLEQLRRRMQLDALMVGASHTHGGAPPARTWWLYPELAKCGDIRPEVKAQMESKAPRADPAYRALIQRRLVDAVYMAWQRREEVKWVMGRTRVEHVAFNRRQRMKDGFTVTHAGKGNPGTVDYAGPVDNELVALGAVNACGQMIGAVVNFGCHATVSSEGGWSADWPYYMRQAVKQAINPAMGVVFLNGCCGDVTQIDNLDPLKEERTEWWAQMLGRRVGLSAVDVLLSVRPMPFQTIRHERNVITLQHRLVDEGRYRQALKRLNEAYSATNWQSWYYDRDVVLLHELQKRRTSEKCELNGLQVGNLLLVTNPAEAFAQTAIAIKKASPMPYTMVAELTNGNLNYVPTPDAFGPNGGGYEARLSGGSFVEVAAFEKITAASIELANKFKPETTRDYRERETWEDGRRPWVDFRPDQL